MSSKNNKKNQSSDYQIQNSTMSVHKIPLLEGGIIIAADRTPSKENHL